MKYLFAILFLLFGYQITVAQGVSEQGNRELVKLKRGKVAVKVFHDNGQLSQTGWLKHNVPHGPWASFDDKGHVLAQAQYDRGYKHGTWRFWGPTGNLLCEIEYHYGTIVAARQYNVQGMVVAALGN